MPSLLLRCHACERPFPSRIAVSEHSPNGVWMFGVLHRCPACGAVDAYFTHEYALAIARDRSAPAAGRPGPGADPGNATSSADAGSLGLVEGDVQRLARRRPSAFGTTL